MRRIKIDHLLVSGHSWTFEKDWFNEIYDARKITNLSLLGAGNKFICDSVIDHILKDRSVDEVFVCLSGLTRMDIPLPKGINPKWLSLSSTAKSFSSDTDHSTYHTNQMAPFRGKDTLLPVEAELVRAQYQERDYKSVKSQSILNIIHLQNFLKVNRIKYRFSFMYDYTNQDFDYNHLTGEGDGNFSTMGSVPADDKLLAQIDRSCVLYPTGIDWALKQPDGLFSDSIHLTAEGYRKWAKELVKSYR